MAPHDPAFLLIAALLSSTSCMAQHAGLPGVETAPHARADVGDGRCVLTEGDSQCKPPVK